MIEYHVFQHHRRSISDHHIITVYKGFSKEKSLEAVQISDKDLADSVVGHNWSTRIKSREVSEWKELDTQDFVG